MRTIKQRLCAALCAVLMMAVLGAGYGAAAQSPQAAELQLSATLVQHTVTVDCGSGGSVLDESGQSVGRPLAVLQGRLLRLTMRPDAGMQVGSVLLDGQDIRSRLAADGTLTLSITADAVLTVTFTAVPKPDTPQTGVAFPMAALLTAAAAGAGLLLCANRRKRHT